MKFFSIRIFGKTVKVVVKVKAGIGKQRSAKGKSAAREHIFILKLCGLRKLKLHPKQLNFIL